MKRRIFPHEAKYEISILKHDLISDIKRDEKVNENDCKNINLREFCLIFENAKSEDEQEKLLLQLKESIGKKIMLQQNALSNLIEKIIPLTHPMRNESIRKPSLDIILKLTEVSSKENLVTNIIFDFCKDSIHGFDDYYLKYIFASLTNLSKIDVYRAKIMNEINVDAFCDALASEQITEMNLKVLCILLEHLFVNHVDIDYSRCVANALSVSRHTNERLYLIYLILCMHKDLLFCFDSNDLLKSIAEQLFKGSQQESVSAILLLSLLIVSGIEFTFDFTPLFDLTQSDDSLLSSAAFNCVANLASTSCDTSHVCIDIGLFEASVKALIECEYNYVRKEALRAVLEMIITMTTSELEEHLNHEILEAIVNGLDYEETCLIELIFNAMNTILLPGYGEMYDDLMSILEECNGWERILELMNDDEDDVDEVIKKAAAIFYHNNADIPIPSIED